MFTQLNLGRLNKDIYTVLYIHEYDLGNMLSPVDALYLVILLSLLLLASA
jgi:hypothetical protein